MNDNDIVEGLLGLVGFSIFFLFATIGIIVSSNNPDSYLYIDYNPPEDFWTLIGLLSLNFLFLCYYLIQSLNFRKSRDLNYRKGELLLISDKMKYYGLCYVIIQVILIYFYIKYIETGIDLSFFLMLLFELCLIILIFYNSFYIISRNNED